MTRPAGTPKIRTVRPSIFSRKEPVILSDLDKSLFYWINSHFQSPLFGKFMVFVSDKYNFLSVGVLAAGIVLLVHKRHGLAYLLILAAVVVFNDFFCHHILKQIFQRLRPCAALPDVIVHIGCSEANFSFPSNHASNIFTAATMTSFCFKNTFLFAIAFASMVGFSRVYLGAHYPSDVLAGAAWGLLMGGLGYLLHQRAIAPIPAKAH
ncbi:MAG: phosphatase PAP2 family protein [Nitrospinaceae bacterium]|nr:MAG: phosphatase PAP2 family protein [Nitrospinaceae bacterium]